MIMKGFRGHVTMLHCRCEEHELRKVATVQASHEHFRGLVEASKMYILPIKHGIRKEIRIQFYNGG